MISLESSPEEVIAEMHRIRELYPLKTTMRYEQPRIEGFSESVAEHLFGMEVLVDYFLPLEDPNGALDRGRIFELIRYHEIGEIETGDIISHKKTDAYEAIERAAAGRVASRLPPILQEIALARFQEFEDVQTKEAQFTKAIDKLEPVFELLDESKWPYFKIQNMTKEIAMGPKGEICKPYPYLTLFLNAWFNLMLTNNVFAE